ncbi:MAG: transposase [Nitrospirae bacterium]|nr:transposase [Nitrospirota bacterium]
MKYGRRSVRLQGYDYAQSGAYFVTMCAQGRECLFGDVVDGDIVLNDAGRITERCWLAIPAHFPHVQLDVFVVMPNHLHGVLLIYDIPAASAVSVGAKNISPLQSDKSAGQRPRGTSKTIGSVIRGFKIGVTKWFRQNTSIHMVWQRNYYEHVVRNDDELNRIREYIVNNPAQWEMDLENPAAGAIRRVVPTERPCEDAQ